MSLYHNLALKLADSIVSLLFLAPNKGHKGLEWVKKLFCYSLSALFPLVFTLLSMLSSKGRLFIFREMEKIKKNGIAFKILL